MKRLVLIALLVACGDKKSDAPAATVGDVVKPETPLAEAKRLLTTVPKRDPEAWVALAHAQAVAKLPEAKTTLAAALSAARADVGDDGTKALVHAVEVAALLGDDWVKLLDEAVTRVEPNAVGILLSSSEMLTHAPTIDRLATLSTKPNVLELVVDGAGPERLPVFAAQVRAVLEEKRLDLLVIMARQARLMGKPDRSFVDEAVVLAQKEMFQEKLDIAIEAAMYGDGTLAKKLVADLPKLAHSQEVRERATTFATLAWIYALSGDKAAADGAEKKAMQAANSDAMPEDAFLEEVWVYLAAARAKRGDLAGALALSKDKLKDEEREGSVAYDLADAGDFESAKRVLEAMTSDWRFTATRDVVETLANRDLDAAKQLLLAAPQQKAMSPGIERVMYLFALRGDVATVRELGTRDRMGTKRGELDAYTGLAARMLAKAGKCADALAASKDVVANRGLHLAVIARFCP